MFQEDESWCGLTDLHCSSGWCRLWQSISRNNFPKQQSEISCLVHQTPPKLQSWCKIANSEIDTMKLNATLFFQHKWLKHVHVLLLAIYILSRR
jgi:hypothetical protein